MANSGSNTNGSQFFITYNRMSKLNKQYTAFAKVNSIETKVIDGFEALDLMEREPVDGNDRPLN
jgi:cyclophilin family peptidyl-prolyl cis-trans isomerase